MIALICMLSAVFRRGLKIYVIFYRLSTKKELSLLIETSPLMITNLVPAKVPSYSRP